MYRYFLPRAACTCRFSLSTMTQVLLFPLCACKRLTPPLHRPTSGQNTVYPQTYPTNGEAPWFCRRQTPFDASSAVHFRSSSFHTPDPIIMWDLFLERSPPLLLAKAAPGGLVSTPARRNRQGPPRSEERRAG